MENNISVKLLICYHKPDKLFKDEILTPIHVGRAQAKASNNKNLAWLEENMIGDDTGENISDKNYCYNELTAPYWAWKNYESLGNPDYVGLMHYRRHFIFDTSLDMGVIEHEGMNEYYMDSINYSPRKVRELVAGNDIVYYKGRVDNIYKHYRENHKKEDLDLALKILEELYPDYAATAKKYVKGDTGCFCNMAIFSREMFFEYCAWLFPILEKFFELVDMSEKRFFISERLTGIFIAKKIADGAKALSLASTFVKTEYTIPVVLPFDASRVFETAVTLQSFIKNADATTHIHFHLLTDGEVDAPTKESLAELFLTRSDCKLTFLDLRPFCEEKGISDILGKTDFYPFLIGEVLPSLGKCFWVTPNTLIMKDVEEFFRICSVDDFWMVGAGEKDAHGAILWSGASAVIHTKRLKDHKVFDAFVKSRTPESTADVLIESIFADQYSVYPSWFWVNADETARLIPENAKRNELQNDALWHTMICYTDKTHPARDIQAIYANFWWNIARTLSGSIVFDLDPTEAAKNLDSDQMVLNTHKARCDGPMIPPSDELSMFKKAKRYYRQFGFKATLRRFFQKLFGK